MRIETYNPKDFGICDAETPNYCPEAMLAMPDKHVERAENWKKNRKNNQAEPTIHISWDFADAEEELIARMERQDERLRATFNELAGKWRDESEYMSFVAQMVMLPTYQRIIGMGRPAVPLILRELQARPDHWFWALNAITGADPAKPGDNFDEAIEAWLEWGRRRGYIGAK